jgi:hypothetical protein
MPNGDALSKTYTLEMAANRAMSRLGIQDPNGNILLGILKEINVAHIDIGKTVRETDAAVRSQYEQTATISFTGGELTYNAVEAVNPLIIEPLRVEIFMDSVKVGQVPFIDPKGFAGLPGNMFYDNAIIYTVSGRRFQLFVGRNVDATAFTYKLIYIRQVNTLIQRTDHLDIPDTSFDEIIKQVEMILQPKKTEAAEVTEK